MNLDLKYLQDEITALLVAYPELDEDEALRADMLEGSTHMDEFLSVMLRKIGATVALAEGTALYIKELQERKDRLERREQAFRTLIKKVMDAANLKKRELPEATVSIRTGPAKVIITNEQEIPVDFWRVKREPDKTRIGAALRAHEFVPGTALSNQEPVLAISVR